MSEGEVRPKKKKKKAIAKATAEGVVRKKKKRAGVEYVDTTWWEDFRDNYLTFDRRTLGIARIFLGTFLLFDLLRRTRDWFHMYADDGVLPSHFNLYRPQSNGWTFFNAFSGHGELIGLWILGFVLFFCILVGYKTRVAQVLAAVYVASMNGRVLLIENGGYVVHNLLLLWTAFLPMGDRFSVDALLTSMKHQREANAADLNDRNTDVAPWRTKPFVSFVGIVILLQLCAIYFFNVKHKTGPAWHNGTAVHYVVYVDRMVTPLIGTFRAMMPPWVYIILTKSVIGMEAAMSVALLSPLARVWARRAAIFFVNYLHIGFGSTFVLGPFAWALCVFSTLLFSPEDWELGMRTMRRAHRARAVRYNPASQAAFFACRLLKRFDRYELLSFEPDAKAQGLEVTAPDGRKRRGAQAFADIVSALPLGPLLGAPTRLPGISHLLEAFGALGGPLARFFGFRRGTNKDEGYRVAAAAPTPVLAQRAEPRDDAGNPTVDAYFMRDWLRDYYRRRLLGPVERWLAIAGIFVGGFLWIYGDSMAKRFELEVTTPLVTWGSTTWTRADGLFWVGLFIFVVALYSFARPFVVMNFTTPSSMTKKLGRMRSGVREALVVAFAAGALNQALVELWVFRGLKAPQPTPVRVLSHKLRYLQGWFMFSPNPVMDDGTIVVDAVTVDGRRVDPFSVEWPPYTLRPPDFDLSNAKSYGYNQIWSDYFNRMHLPANTSFRKPMQEYAFRLPERTGNPDDAIVKGTVYWTHDMNPRFGQTVSYGYGRDELFKFSNPDPAVQARWRELTGGQDPPEIPVPVGTPKPEARN
jgi:hypothetical protein